MLRVGAKLGFIEYMLKINWLYKINNLLLMESIGEDFQPALLTNSKI
ncbi:hypothetical protein EPYR_02590 [Erwinia pyrifoliae DSM 12163]|nr:hypothetical protein EPYR_02590 [Erwinia pyrifoliae DSM 12163]